MPNKSWPVSIRRFVIMLAHTLGTRPLIAVALHFLRFQSVPVASSELTGPGDWALGDLLSNARPAIDEFGRGRK